MAVSALGQSTPFGTITYSSTSSRTDFQESSPPVSPVSTASFAGGTQDPDHDGDVESAETYTAVPASGTAEKSQSPPGRHLNIKI